MSELLPPNATRAEIALAGTVARISSVPVPPRSMWNPDTCPPSVLPWLAWAFSVDEWDTSWTTEQKRETIKRSVVVHRYKGTIGAVREAIEALGFDATVLEWFQRTPAGDPYTFGVEIETVDVGWNLAQLLTLLEVIESTKNLRSHLDGVTPVARSSGQLFAGGIAKLGTQITVQFEA